MNKIKLLYDVVKTMKGKDMFDGVVTAEVQKDQGRIFYLRNEFQKNLLTNQVKANIMTELDYEGKKVKHQSNTELTNPCCGHKLHHKMWSAMHEHHDGNCCSFKAKLAKISFALSLLNSLQIEEQEDKAILIRLELNEIPEDIKAHLHEKMSSIAACHAQEEHPGFIKECCSVDKGVFTLTMTVNKSYEVEKTAAVFNGTQRTEQNEQHAVNVQAELQLAW